MAGGYRFIANSQLMVVIIVDWINCVLVGVLYGQFVYRVLSVFPGVWGTFSSISMLMIDCPGTNGEHDVLTNPSKVLICSFIPAVGVTAQWYYQHRGLASGVTFTGGSIAGIVLPIAMRRLFTKVGFPWTVRIVGFIFLFSLILGNLLIRPRIPPSKMLSGKIIDLSALKDMRFTLLGMGIFFSDWALFGPITFITSYSLAQGIDSNLSYYMIAILNVGSSLGRIIPGLLADKIGP